MDKSQHIHALGELCDCDRCLVTREAERRHLANYTRASADPGETIAEQLVVREVAAFREQLRAQGAARGTVTPIRPVDRERVPDPPTFLGDFRGQVPQGRAATRGEIAGMLAFAAVLGGLIWALLPGGGQ